MAPLQQSMTTHNCTIPSKCPVPSKTVDEESEQQTSSIAGCQKYRDIEGHNGVFMWHTCETRGDDFLGVQAGYMGHCPEILWRNANKQSLWASCRTLQSCVPTTWKSHVSYTCFNDFPLPTTESGLIFSFLSLDRTSCFAKSTGWKKYRK